MSNSENYDYSSKSEVPRSVNVLTPEDLLVEPHSIKISCEFGKNLVLRYLKFLNLHDPVIVEVRKTEARGLTRSEYTERVTLYLTLTSVIV